MMIICFKVLGSTIKGKVLWQIACLTLIWIVWWERNAKNFQDKWRISKMLQDLIYFYSSFWASSITAFKGTPLIDIHLDWY